MNYGGEEIEVTHPLICPLFASWPIALGQGLRALADVAEYVREQQSRVR